MARTCAPASEKSSSSAALALARATTSGGNCANSATWIPKDWSQAPGATRYSIVRRPVASSMAVSTCWFETPPGPCRQQTSQ